MTVVSGCPLILSDSHILKSFHTKSWVVKRIRNRIYEARPWVDWVCEAYKESCEWRLTQHWDV